MSIYKSAAVAHAFRRVGFRTRLRKLNEVRRGWSLFATLGTADGSGEPSFSERSGQLGSADGVVLAMAGAGSTQICRGTQHSRACNLSR